MRENTPRHTWLRHPKSDKCGQPPTKYCNITNIKQISPSPPQKKNNWCYFSHRSRHSVSPECRIFTELAQWLPESVSKSGCTSVVCCVCVLSPCHFFEFLFKHIIASIYKGLSVTFQNTLCLGRGDLWSKRVLLILGWNDTFYFVLFCASMLFGIFFCFFFGASQLWASLLHKGFF